MQFTNIFKHHDKHDEANKQDKATHDEHKADKKSTDENHKHHHSFFKHDKVDESLPKGFANDATRTSNKPDTLYNFDDPLARRLGPVPTEDPTNTGA